MRSTGLLTVAVLLGVGAVLLIEQGTGQQRSLAGGVLLLVGVPLVGLARRQLGSAFAVSPQAKGLVTKGLYARIPHPMYVFLDLALLGGIIIVGQTWLLVGGAVLVIVQVWQAAREAQVLERTFGDAYREYRKRTWW
jgi:protein-S-isoprenylcysteine O-methyltransferase Ste14